MDLMNLFDGPGYAEMAGGRVQWMQKKAGANGSLACWPSTAWMFALDALRFAGGWTEERAAGQGSTEGGRGATEAYSGLE